MLVLLVHSYEIGKYGLNEINGDVIKNIIFYFWLSIFSL